MAPNDQSQAAPVLVLPTSLISRVDATRLGRELEVLSDFFEQQARHHAKATPPQASQALEEIATSNKLDLAQTDDRSRLYEFLLQLKKNAPTIHMSFAAEPSSAFTTKLLTWLRSEIHPLTLLDVGLQPSIGAGCIIRTNSKYFDCSMRQHLVEHKPKLLDLIRGVKHA